MYSSNINIIINIITHVIRILAITVYRLIKHPIRTIIIEISMDILKYKNISFISKAFDKLSPIVELQMTDLGEVNILIKYQLNIKPINDIISHQKHPYHTNH